MTTSTRITKMQTNEEDDDADRDDADGVVRGCQW